MVRHGETALMTCSIETPPFIGFFDSLGKPINSSAKYKIAKEDDTYILEILKVDESDYGVYMCKDSGSEDTATVEVDGTFFHFTHLYYLFFMFYFIELFPFQPYKYFAYFYTKEHDFFVPLDTCGVNLCLPYI